MRAWPERLLLLTRRHATAAVFLASLVAATALYIGPALLHLGRYCVPTCYSDLNIYAWSYQWMLEAIRTGHSPLSTSLVGAPGTLDLTWVTTLIAPAFIMSPVTALIGPFSAVAISNILAVSLSTTAAYVLCREVVQRHFAALVGGVLFGFGSYSTVRFVHLNLLIVFPLPLIVVQAIRLYRGAISQRQYILRVAGLCVFQFYTSTETFATAVLFGAIAFSLIWWQSQSFDRPILVALLKGSVAALALTGLFAAPFLFQALSHHPESIAFPLQERSAVLADLVVPSPFHLFGAAFADLRTSLGYRDASVSGAAIIRTSREAYLGPVLLLLLLRGRKCARKYLFPFGVFFTIVVLLSFGPIVRVVPGGAGIPGPGWLLERVPLIGFAFPIRFPLYLWLSMAVFTAIAVAALPRPVFRGRNLMVGLVCAFTIAPGPAVTAPPIPVSRLDSPPALRDGTARWLIAAGDVVLARGTSEQSLRWQIEGGMRFRLVDGLLGPYTPWRDAMPRSPAVVPNADGLMKTLKRGKVRWVMFAGSEPLGWARLLSGLTRWPAVRTGGLVLWDVSAISGASVPTEIPSLEAQASLRRAQEYEKEGLLSQAADMYRDVLDVRPRNRWAHLGLGKIYERYGDKERAALHYQVALAANPRYVAALLSLARLWRSVGFESGAFVAYERVAGIRPDLLNVYERLFLQEGPGDDR